MKTGLMGVSSMALGGPVFGSVITQQDGKLREYVSLYTGRKEPGVATTCGLCPAGCGVLAYVQEGRLVGLAGNPEHPYNRGALCALGSAVENLLTSPSRILRPLRRKGKRGEGKWEEISWQEAIHEVTLNLERTLNGARSGPLAVSVPGREITPFLHRYLACFPRGILEESDGYELSIEREIKKDFWDGAEVSPDLGRTGLVLNFGANPLGSNRSLVGTARQWAEGRERNTRWITLDPRLSHTANASQEWVPIRPGTDRAFASAMAHVMLQNGWWDQAFLRQNTDLDPTLLQETFRPWTPERAAGLCGISEGMIRKIVREFAYSDSAVALYGSGVTARKGGDASARSVLLLNLLKGNIGRRGGYRIQRPVGWQHFGPQPVSSQTALLGGTLFYGLETGRMDAGCLISCYANPAATDPQCGSTEEVLKDQDKVPFHAALSCTWNETVRMADIVLPASTYLESWGVSQGFSASGRNSWINLRQPVLRQIGEARSPEDVLMETAKNLGGDLKKAFPFEKSKDYYRALVNRTFQETGQGNVFTGLENKGFFVTHDSGEEREKQQERTEDSKGACSQRAVRTCIRTCKQALPGNHRIRLARWIPQMAAPLEKIAPGNNAGAKEKTLVLFSAPTQGDEALQCEWIEEIRHAFPVWIHPDTAAELGCRQGDWVILKGPSGEIRTRVKLTQGIHPEAVAMEAEARDRIAHPNSGGDPVAALQPEGPEVWWRNEIYGQNVRRIIPWPADPFREAPGWEDTRVVLKRLEEKTGS